MSCRSKLLKQQRHPGELRAEPSQLWWSSLAQAASQTPADSQPYKYFHAAWITAHLVELAQLSLRCATRRAGQKSPGGFESLWDGVDAVNARLNSAWALGRAGPRTAAGLVSALWSTACRLQMVRQHPGCIGASTSAPITLMGPGPWVDTGCAGFLSSPGDGSTAQMHPNGHRSDSARLNAAVLWGERAAGLHPGSLPVLHVPDSRWLLVNWPGVVATYPSLTSEFPRGSLSPSITLHWFAVPPSYKLQLSWLPRAQVRLPKNTHYIGR